MNRRRSAIAVVLVSCLIGAAGYVAFVREAPEARIPDDPAHAATFVCERDGYSFSLTPKALRTAMESANLAPGNRADRHALMVRCPRCGQLTARRVGTRGPASRPAHPSPPRRPLGT